MRTHSPLVVDVLEALETPGLRKHIRLSVPVPGLEAGLARVDPAEAIGLDLLAEAIEGGLYVQGTVSGRYAAECRRCLAPVGRPFSFPAAELYRPAGDVWEEGYAIKEEKIDLEPLVRDTVLLNLPADPVCRADCKGLCPGCGANRNEGPCACPAETSDPRWSALRELGERLTDRPTP